MASAESDIGYFEIDAVINRGANAGDYVNWTENS